MEGEMKILGIIIALLLLFTLVACEDAGTPTKPTLITNQCTNLSTTSLTAQGKITGGTNITRRGFYYGTDPLYGLEFDGVNDLVRLPAGSRPTGAFTLAIWCKPIDWEHTNYPGLFGGAGLRTYQGGLFGIAINRYQNYIYFDVADGANAARRTINPLINNIAPEGEWSFIVLTNSGVAEAGGLKLYRNSAILVGNTTGAASVLWSENQTYLGYGGATGCYFKGIIGEVRIYDRALNEAEIKTLYNGQDVTGSLRGLWKLDEGSGLTAYDSSGNDNHGTLVNGPVWFTGGDIVDQTGNFGTGTYSLDITGLEPDTWYRIMAFAENELGIGCGNVVSCKTLE
jgi:hypothetical protein